MRALAVLFFAVFLAGCLQPEPARPPERAQVSRDLLLDAPVFGSIDATAQQEIWRLDHTRHGTLRLRVLPDGSGTPLQGARLSVFSSEGREIASRSGTPGTALILPDLPRGIYRVVVQSLKTATGGYRLTAQGLTEIGTTPIQG